MTRFLAVLALRLLPGLLLPGLATAQNWQLRTHDDGSYFMAVIYQSPGFALSCGERSPRGLSAMDTGNMEPTLTRPSLLRMSLSDEELGFPQGIVAPRDDVMIVAGTLGYTLPGVRFDELFNEWWVDLPADDPVFAAIASAEQGVDIRSSSGTTPVDATGFAQGHAALSAHCRRMFAAIGKPWPGTSAPQLPPNSGTMRAAAEADILRGCNGPSTKGHGYLLAGEIDGDGREDVVLDWQSVECGSGMPRPFCGASTCTADVYLSASHAARGGPETLLAQGVSLVPLSNGNMGVRVGQSLGTCGGINCSQVFYWTGTELDMLP